MSERDAGDGRLDPGASVALGVAVETSATEREGLAGAALDRLELPIEVRLGRVVWRLDRVLGLRVGDGIPFGEQGDDAVTLYVQGQPYARGELLVADGRFAFRVRELCAGAAGGRRP